MPNETAAVARSILPEGTLYLLMRDELGTFYSAEDFAELKAGVGQPAEAAWRLALVRVRQFAEDLTDRQAADAVRTRIDWEYALGWGLRDRGFPFSVLNDFRDRVLNGSAESVVLDKLGSVFQERGWLKAGQGQRSDATPGVAAVRSLTRIELVGETLRQALHGLATVLADWLEAQVSGEGYEDDGRSFEVHRLPKTEPERLALAEQIGRDGWPILVRVNQQTAWPWLKHLPGLVTLGAVWEQQYSGESATVHGRSKADLPAWADLICTPYDPHARYSRKRETTWIGYKVHLTETCQADAPHLITHVETTPATQPHSTALAAIHADLEDPPLLPSQQFTDTAYVSSANWVSSQTQQIDLVGPVNPHNSWQAQTAEGFDVSHFQIDWTAQVVHCPAGQSSERWFDPQDRHANPVIQVRFARQACLTGPLRTHCTASAHGPPILTLQPQAQQGA